MCTPGRRPILADPTDDVADDTGPLGRAILWASDTIGIMVSWPTIIVGCLWWLIRGPFPWYVIWLSWLTTYIVGQWLSLFVAAIAPYCGRVSMPRLMTSMSRRATSALWLSHASGWIAAILVGLSVWHSEKVSWWVAVLVVLAYFGIGVVVWWLHFFVSGLAVSLGQRRAVPPRPIP